MWPPTLPSGTSDPLIPVPNRHRNQVKSRPIARRRPPQGQCNTAARNTRCTSPDHNIRSGCRRLSLKVKRDLFGCPGDSAIDGSAHIIKDRGFLFLYRGGFDKKVNRETTLRASIPINRWLQLTENPDALYQLKEIYPREGTDLGVYKYGEEFLYDMPRESAVILSIEPAPVGMKPRRPVQKNQPKMLVVPAFGA